MGVADILGRLDRVRMTAPGNWRAVCPAHPSKHRSQTLQVSERSDGSVGIWCHAGCEARVVLGCIGLNVSDLFAEPLTKERLRPSRRQFRPEDTLEILAEEGSVIALAGAQLLENKPLSETDWQALAVAVGKINSAVELYRGR